MVGGRSLPRPLALCAAILITLTACGGAGSSSATPAASATPVATKPPTFDEAAEAKKLYDAAVAAKETELNFYGTINEAEAKPLIDIWNRAYPTIKLNYIRGDDNGLLSRVLTEEQSGKHNFDVLLGQNAHLLAAPGLSLSYLPPNAQLIDPDYKDKAGQWIGLYANWNVIQINTDKIKKGEIKGYEDLANAKYKGQILVDNSDYEWYAGLVAIRGQQQTDDLLQKIVNTAGVTNLTGHGNINDKVVAGEFPIALNNYLNQAERSKRAGAPTEWIAVEPVVVQLGKYAISKNSPHPNAAKLLSNFLISFDAQKYLTSMGRITTRIDVPNDPPNLVSGLKKYAAAPMQSDQQNVIAAKMKQLFK